MKNHRIALQVKTGGRECSLVPMSTEIDLKEFFKGDERKKFNSPAIRMNFTKTVNYRENLSVLL